MVGGLVGKALDGGYEREEAVEALHDDVDVCPGGGVGEVVQLWGVFAWRKGGKKWR